MPQDRPAYIRGWIPSYVSAQNLSAMAECENGPVWQKSARSDRIALAFRACRSFPDDEVYQAAGNGDFLYDFLAGQQLLHTPIDLHQRQQLLGGHIGVGNDLVSDPPVQLDDIFSLVVSGEIGIEDRPRRVGQRFAMAEDEPQFLAEVGRKGSEQQH